MSLQKRVTAILMIVIVVGFTFFIGKMGVPISEKKEEPVFSNDKDTITLWYTDDSLTSYLSSAAVTYNENHDVRVVPVLETGLEYLEQINQSSVTDNTPDLYIISHDSLEKAYLAGLACEIEPTNGLQMSDAFINTGLQACTYKDKILGYPFYFETSSLLYNKTYLEDMARNQMQAEVDQQAAEDSQDELAKNGPDSEEDKTDAPAQASAGEAYENFSQEEIEKKVAELMPSTIEGIREFADSYDAPEQVEGVFKWDVTDIFYNYFFVGNAINMGGEAGWDTTLIDIYNLNAIKSMRAYQELNQFFSIDTTESSYDSILDEFMAGKMVFTVATTDAVSKLEQAKTDGTFAYDYGVVQLPNINDEIQTRSLSMTGCLAINGYSKHKEAANDFANFLTTQYNDILYARSGKVSAAKNVNHDVAQLQGFVTEYQKSISMPKMMETSNFWVQLEVAFSEIWQGADANKQLMELSEQIKTQVTGKPYTEEKIEETQEGEEAVEYLDEEYYRQEALEENAQ